MCRSRRELSNEYLLAKIGVDTAENEPLEVWGKIIQYYSFVSLKEMPEVSGGTESDCPQGAHGSQSNKNRRSADLPRSRRNAASLYLLVRKYYIVHTAFGEK